MKKLTFNFIKGRILKEGHRIFWLNVSKIFWNSFSRGPLDECFWIDGCFWCNPTYSNRTLFSWCSSLNINLITSKNNLLHRDWLKENFTLIHEIWLLLTIYNFLWFYDLLFLMHQKVDNGSWDIYVFSHKETE